MTLRDAVLCAGYWAAGVMALYLLAAAVTAAKEGRRIWRQHYIKDVNMGDSGVVYLGGPLIVRMALWLGLVWPKVWLHNWRTRKEQEVWRPLTFFDIGGP